MLIIPNSKTKDVLSLVIGWHSNCSLYMCMYVYTVSVYTETESISGLMYNVCVHDQTGSELRSCDWPSFKMNRPLLAYDSPLEFQWENKETHKLSVLFERVRGRNAQPYPRLSY